MGEINLDPTCEFSKLDDDIELRCWFASDPVIGCTLLVHGLGAHSGWFEAMAARLSRRGLLSVSYDHRGFGRRKHLPVQSYRQWIDDLCLVYGHLAQCHGQVYLMANSMGALLAIAAIHCHRQLFYSGQDSSRKEDQPGSRNHSRPRLPGLAVFSPGFDGYPGTFTLWYRLRAIMSALLMPNAPVDLPYGPETITRDQYVRGWIANDPDHLARVPGRMLLELLKLSKSIEKISPVRIEVPVLMLTAGVERIVNPAANKKFFEQLDAPIKQWKQYDEAYHDLMFDPLLDTIADDIQSWLAERAPSAKLA